MGIKYKVGKLTVLKTPEDGTDGINKEYVDNKAATAESNANDYTDTKIEEIPKIQYKLPIIFIGTDPALAINNDKWDTQDKFQAILDKYCNGSISLLDSTLKTNTELRAMMGHHGIIGDTPAIIEAQRVLPNYLAVPQIVCYGDNLSTNIQFAPENTSASIHYPYIFSVVFTSENAGNNDATLNIIGGVLEVLSNSTFYGSNGVGFNSIYIRDTDIKVTYYSKFVTRVSVTLPSTTVTLSDVVIDESINIVIPSLITNKINTLRIHNSIVYAIQGYTNNLILEGSSVELAKIYYNNLDAVYSYMFNIYEYQLDNPIRFLDNSTILPQQEYKLPIVFIGTDPALEINNKKWNTYENVQSMFKKYSITNWAEFTEKVKTDTALQGELGYHLDAMDYNETSTNFIMEQAKKPHYLNETQVMYFGGTTPLSDVNITTESYPESMYKYSVMPIFNVEIDQSEENYSSLQITADEICLYDQYSPFLSIKDSSVFKSINITSAELRPLYSISDMGSTMVPINASIEINITGCYVKDGYILQLNTTDNTNSIVSLYGCIINDLSVGNDNLTINLTDSVIHRAAIYYKTLSMSGSYMFNTNEKYVNATRIIEENSVLLPNIAKPTKAPILFIGTNPDLFYNNYKWDTQEKFDAMLKKYNLTLSSFSRAVQTNTELQAELGYHATSSMSSIMNIIDEQSKLPNETDMPQVLLFMDYGEEYSNVILNNETSFYDYNIYPIFLGNTAANATLDVSKINIYLPNYSDVLFSKADNTPAFSYVNFSDVNLVNMFKAYSMGVMPYKISAGGTLNMYNVSSPSCGLEIATNPATDAINKSMIIDGGYIPRLSVPSQNTTYSLGNINIVNTSIPNASIIYKTLNMRNSFMFNTLESYLDEQGVAETDRTLWNSVLLAGTTTPTPTA